MDPESDELREYGLPKVEPTDVPSWARLPEEDRCPCPNCGAEVVRVKVAVNSPLLKGGAGLATYLGCPACPWASPSVAMSLEADAAEG